MTRAILYLFGVTPAVVGLAMGSSSKAERREPWHASAPAAAAPLGSIHGTVRSALGPVLPDARVCIAALDPAHTSALVNGTCAVADRAGRYQLGRVPSGTYRLVATARGHLDDAPVDATGKRAAQVQVAGARGEWDFALTPAEPWVSGVALDATGGEVAGARIELTGSPSGDDPITAYSDDAGAFAVEAFAGTVKLHATAPGHAAVDMELTAPATHVRIVFRSARR